MIHVHVVVVKNTKIVTEKNNKKPSGFFILRISFDNKILHVIIHIKGVVDNEFTRNTI